MFIGNYYALRFEIKLQILTFLRIFSIFDVKIRVFDEVYAYVILQFAVVSQHRACVKKCILIAFVYQKLLHGEINKKGSKTKEFSFFPNFVVKLKAFELTCECWILYFPVVSPV